MAIILLLSMLSPPISKQKLLEEKLENHILVCLFAIYDGGVIGA